jgi:hypothetical protein
LPENQCVFIRGYRVSRTFWILPRRLKAAAGPSRDPDGYDCDPDTEVISIPAITNVKISHRLFSIFSNVCFSKYRDPLYLLLDYIAEVGITGLVSYLAIHNTPDIDMSHAAGI